MAGGNGRSGRVESPEIFIGGGECWPFEVEFIFLVFLSIVERK